LARSIPSLMYSAMTGSISPSMFSSTTRDEPASGDACEDAPRVEDGMNGSPTRISPSATRRDMIIRRVGTSPISMSLLQGRGPVEHHVKYQDISYAGASAK